MVIIPKEKPFIENLNSYYLDVRRLFEHYQGEFGSGCIHFQAPSAEAIIFFNKDELLNGVFRENDGETSGRAAMERLLEKVPRYNFQINIYKIDAKKIQYWANTAAAKIIYNRLSTEFTDLKGLLKKMYSEALTGFINISIGKGQESGLLFLLNGKIIDGSYSWGKGLVSGTEQNNKLLISKTLESGGTFDVGAISLEQRSLESEPKENMPKSSSDTFKLLEGLLCLLERGITSKKKIKEPFSKLLKKKFLEKVNKYPFLDPFAAEFEYTNQKIAYAGNISDDLLVQGVIESAKELAEEHEILHELKGILGQLSPK